MVGSTEGYMGLGKRRERLVVGREEVVMDSSEECEVVVVVRESLGDIQRVMGEVAG